MMDEGFALITWRDAVLSVRISVDHGFDILERLLLELGDFFDRFDEEPSEYLAQLARTVPVGIINS